MASGKPPKVPRASVAKAIENLAFVDDVDTMLIENVSITEVARFIQEDQKQLPNVGRKTLLNELTRRRNIIRDEADVDATIEESLSGEEEGSDEDEDFVQSASQAFGPKKTNVVNISRLARSAYKRSNVRVRELFELEAIYLAQRYRLDRLIDFESEKQVVLKETGREFVYATDTIEKMISLKEKMGILGDWDRPHITRDYKGYSEETKQVLQKPEARRRVLSLVERLGGLGKLPEGAVSVAKEEDDKEANPEDEDSSEEQTAQE